MKQLFNSTILLALILMAGIIEPAHAGMSKSGDPGEGGLGGDGGGDIPFCAQLRAPEDGGKVAIPDFLDSIYGEDQGSIPASSLLTDPATGKWIPRFLPRQEDAPDPTDIDPIDIFIDDDGNATSLEDYADRNGLSEQFVCEVVLGDSWEHKNVYVCGECLPMHRIEVEEQVTCTGRIAKYTPSYLSFRYGEEPNLDGTCTPYVSEKTSRTQQPFDYCDATCPCINSDGGTDRLKAIPDVEASGWNEQTEDVYQVMTPSGVQVKRLQRTNIKHSVACNQKDMSKVVGPEEIAVNTYQTIKTSIYNQLKEVWTRTTMTYKLRPDAF